MKKVIIFIVLILLSSHTYADELFGKWSLVYMTYNNESTDSLVGKLYVNENGTLTTFLDSNKDNTYTSDENNTFDYLFKLNQTTSEDTRSGKLIFNNTVYNVLFTFIEEIFYMYLESEDENGNVIKFYYELIE